MDVSHANLKFERECAPLPYFNEDYSYVDMVDVIAGSLLKKAPISSNCGNIVDCVNLQGKEAWDSPSNFQFDLLWKRTLSSSNYMCVAKPWPHRGQRTMLKTWP